MGTQPEDGDSSRTFTDFEDFWPFYLGEHALRANRTVHVVGTTLALGLLMGVLVTTQWTLLGFVPVIGYGFAWFGHFVIEKNRPATFGNPIYSLRGDFRMCGLAWTGKLQKEVERLGVGS